MAKKCMNNPSPKNRKSARATAESANHDAAESVNIAIANIANIENKEYDSIAISDADAQIIDAEYAAYLTAGAAAAKNNFYVYAEEAARYGHMEKKRIKIKILNYGLSLLED